MVPTENLNLTVYTPSLVIFIPYKSYSFTLPILVWCCHGILVPATLLSVLSAQTGPPPYHRHPKRIALWGCCLKGSE